MSERLPGDRDAESGLQLSRQVMSNGSPLEVLRMIFATTERGTLATCSAVCKLWKEETTPLLYNHINLMSDRQLVSFTHHHVEGWSTERDEEVREHCDIHEVYHRNRWIFDHESWRRSSAWDPRGSIKDSTRRLHEIIRSVRICNRSAPSSPLEVDMLVRAVQPLDALHIEFREKPEVALNCFSDMLQLRSTRRAGCWSDQAMFADNPELTCRRIASLLSGEDLTAAYSDSGVRSLCFTARSVDLAVSWEQLPNVMGEGNDCGVLVDHVAESLNRCEHVNVFFIDDFPEVDHVERDIYPRPIESSDAEDLDSRYLEVWCKRFVQKSESNTTFYMLANIPLIPDRGQSSDQMQGIEGEEVPPPQPPAPLGGLLRGLSPTTGQMHDSIATAVSERLEGRRPLGSYAFKSRADWQREHGNQHHFEPDMLEHILTLDNTARKRRYELRGSFEVDFVPDFRPEPSVEDQNSVASDVADFGDDSVLVSNGAYR